MTLDATLPNQYLEKLSWEYDTSGFGCYKKNGDCFLFFSYISINSQRTVAYSYSVYGEPRPLQMQLSSQGFT